MEISKNATGFTLEAAQLALIEKKFQRVKYAEDSMTNVSLRVKFENKRFSFDCDVNFVWGAKAHISQTADKFNEGLDLLMDTLDLKVKKEKEKSQKH